MFKCDCVLSHPRDPRLRVDLNPTFFQCLFDILADLLSHAGYKPIGHLNYYHARFAPQRATFYCIAQEVRHLCRELDAAGPSAHNREGQCAMRILRREFGSTWSRVSVMRRRRRFASARLRNGSVNCSAPCTPE